jgi:hypothetical protein
LETLIGIVIGIIATVAVGHYYYRRSLNKHLSVYVVLSSRVFSGIDKTVREHLSFLFHGKQIYELQQVELIIANDGERPISDCIKPLRLMLPNSIAILDASILHKSSEGIEVAIEQGSSGVAGYFLQFNFPLLNKGDYFLVKLLLDGAIRVHDMCFHVTAEDLPRVIKPKVLPFMATRPKRQIEWIGVNSGAFFLAFTVIVAYLGFSYFELHKNAFPWPWHTFAFSWPATVILLLTMISSALCGLLGILLFIGMGFENFYRKGAKFPLPDELHGRSLALLSNPVQLDFSIDDYLENPGDANREAA